MYIPSTMMFDYKEEEEILKKLKEKYNDEEKIYKGWNYCFYCRRIMPQYSIMWHISFVPFDYKGNPAMSVSPLLIQICNHCFKVFAVEYNRIYDAFLRDIDRANLMYEGRE